MINIISKEKEEKGKLVKELEALPEVQAWRGEERKLKEVSAKLKQARTEAQQAKEKKRAAAEKLELGEINKESYRQTERAVIDAETNLDYLPDIVETQKSKTEEARKKAERKALALVSNRFNELVETNIDLMEKARQNYEKEQALRNALHEVDPSTRFPAQDHLPPSPFADVKGDDGKAKKYFEAIKKLKYRIVARDSGRAYSVDESKFNSPKPIKWPQK